MCMYVNLRLCICHVIKHYIFFGYMVFVWCTVCIGVCAYMQENSPCTVCVQNLYLGCKHAPENRVNRLCVC